MIGLNVGRRRPNIEEIEGEDEGDQLQQDEEIGGDDDYEFDFDA